MLAIVYLSILHPKLSNQAYQSLFLAFATVSQEYGSCLHKLQKSFSFLASCAALKALLRYNASHNPKIEAILPAQESKKGDGAGLRCQARDQTGWGGVRATVGAFQGKLYYEAQIADEGLCRVGWSLKHCSLDLGTQLGSFGYGGTGKKSSRRQFDDYGSSYGLVSNPSFQHVSGRRRHFAL